MSERAARYELKVCVGFCKSHSYPNMNADQMRQHVQIVSVNPQYNSCASTKSYQHISLAQHRLKMQQDAN